MNGPLPTELKFRKNTVFILFDASMQCFGLFINKSTAELSSLFSYYLSDTSLFHLPSRSTAIHKQSTVFGVSCYKQVDSKVCYNFLLLLTSAGLVSTKAPDCKAGCHRCDLRIHVLLWLLLLLPSPPPPPPSSSSSSSSRGHLEKQKKLLEWRGEPRTSSIHIKIMVSMLRYKPEPYWWERCCAHQRPSPALLPS